ncbi:MAG: hypothetical protein WC819_01790 [Parcubacteria group bacterium]|jgi:hypothetical protein
MKDQKVSTILGTTILIIIAATVAGFTFLCVKNTSIKTNIAPTVVQPRLSQKKGVLDDVNKNITKEDLLIASDWKMVSHKNFWNNPDLFSHSNYFFPQIVFYYPENWYFQCCNDMNYASVHNIFSSQDQKTSKPYIRITNYSLLGCPSTKKQCSLDEKITLSANEKFLQLISEIPQKYNLPSVHLSNIDADAFMYQKLEKDGNFSKGCFVKLRDGVIGVDFVHDDLFVGDFIEKFLSTISYEIK